MQCGILHVFTNKSLVWDSCWMSALDCWNVLLSKWISLKNVKTGNHPVQTPCEVSLQLWLTIPVWPAQGKLPFQLLLGASLILWCSLPIEKLHIFSLELWSPTRQTKTHPLLLWQRCRNCNILSIRPRTSSCHGEPGWCEVCSYFKLDKIWMCWQLGLYCCIRTVHTLWKTCSLGTYNAIQWENNQFLMCCHPHANNNLIGQRSRIQKSCRL